MRMTLGPSIRSDRSATDFGDLADHAGEVARALAAADASAQIIVGLGFPERFCEGKTRWRLPLESGDRSTSVQHVAARELTEARDRSWGRDERRAVLPRLVGQVILTDRTVESLAGGVRVVRKAGVPSIDASGIETG